MSLTVINFEGGVLSLGAVKSEGFVLSVQVEPCWRTSLAPRLAGAVTCQAQAAQVPAGGAAALLFGVRPAVLDALAKAVKEHVHARVHVLAGEGLTEADRAHLSSALDAPTITAAEGVAASVFGGLQALAAKRAWAAPSAVFLGESAAGAALRTRLEAAGWALPAEGACDVVVPCAPIGRLDAATIAALECSAVAGPAQLQLDVETLSASKVALFNQGVEYYDEAVLSMGAVRTVFGFEDAEALGAENMQRMMHEQSVVTQYDTDEKRKFYAEVMGDGTDNIHFGLWDGVDLEEDGAYGQASVNMTEWMWAQARTRNAVPAGEVETYVDLGSGTGSAARHLCQEHPNVHATCLNLCPNQNAENRARADAVGVGDRVTVVDGTFDRLPEAWTETFNGIFSQDAFVHAFSKKTSLAEALRVAKPGAWLVLSDLHCGDGPDVTADELHTFAQTNMVNDWLTPEQVVEVAKEVGWTDVTFEDKTGDIKLSFELMLKKVSKVIASGVHEGVNLGLLETYKTNLSKRVGQVEKGVFKWGALLARKAL